MAVIRRALQLAVHAAVVVALVNAVKLVGELAKENSVEEVTCEGPEETCSLPTSRRAHLKQCGIWLAPSSLPGAGLGMFAGRDFAKKEELQQSGDVVIPIIDIMMHQTGRRKFTFLWDEYTWNGRSLGIGHEVMKECNAASPGFGAAANSFLDLVNVEEGDPENTMPSGLHRSKDPGVGAFSTYHNRKSIAKVKITKGEELFVNYGQHWFEQRIRLGPIPIRKGLQKSTKFYRQYKLLRDNNPQVEPVIYDELWDEFVKHTEWNESRIIGAFQHTEQERFGLDRNMTLKRIRVIEGTRTQEWLEEHGVCGDHIREGVSTIRQAGRGAFATRALPQGALVSHLPLIQINDKSFLEMYALKDIKKKKRGERTRVGYQLMMNYCLGHTNSTMLLCPYGPMSNYVNHNQTRANVKLQWSDPKRSNHVPDLLEMTVDEFAKDRVAKLAMDLVATRPIAEGEEVLLDYGDAWEKAWQRHVQNWNPEGADEYISAFMLNKEVNSSVFRTEFEQHDEPYPGNINVECDSNIWKRIDQTLFNTTLVINVTKPDSHKFCNCDVLRRRTVNETTLYTVVVTCPEEKKRGEKEKKVEKEEKPMDKLLKQVQMLEHIPSMAIRFTDRPYTSDMFLQEAFRHPIVIPDDVFPWQWMDFTPI